MQAHSMVEELQVTDAGTAASRLGKESILDQSAEDWCRANIHAEFASECVITLKRTMVETLGDLLFLVSSARALYLLDMSAEAGQALWNALAPCSGEQARQQLEAESSTSIATGDEVTGFVAPKLGPQAQEATQEHKRIKTAGHSQRKNADEPAVQDNRAHQSTSKSIKRQADKQEKTDAEATKDAANAGLLSDSRQSKSLFRSQLKHKRGQSAKAPKKITANSSRSATGDESAPRISESDGDTKSSCDRSPWLREKPPSVGGRSPSRPSPRSLSHDDRRMARERLESTASKSVRKRQGALTPPPMPPMTPTRPTARISRLQHLATPSPVRRAQLEPSPDVDHHSGGPTLSRAERLKAQERLLSPAVPREPESPECQLLNVRSPPSDA